VKITRVESLHADAGQRNFDFFKISTDAGLVTVKPVIENGHLVLPSAPGWGTEVNEEAVRAHPPRKR